MPVSYLPNVLIHIWFYLHTLIVGFTVLKATFLQ